VRHQPAEPRARDGAHGRRDGGQGAPASHLCPNPDSKRAARQTEPWTGTRFHQHPSQIASTYNTGFPMFLRPSTPFASASTPCNGDTTLRDQQHLHQPNVERIASMAPLIEGCVSAGGRHHRAAGARRATGPGERRAAHGADAGVPAGQRHGHPRAGAVRRLRQLRDQERPHGAAVGGGDGPRGHHRRAVLGLWRQGGLRGGHGSHGARGGGHSGPGARQRGRLGTSRGDDERLESIHQEVQSTTNHYCPTRPRRWAPSTRCCARAL
jgi:hypothetical protein